MASRCLACGRRDIPVLWMGLGTLGYCMDCLINPAIRAWSFDACPFCMRETGPARRICPDCREEGVWIMLEATIAKRRGLDIPIGPHVGADRRERTPL